MIKRALSRFLRRSPWISDLLALRLLARPESHLHSIGWLRSVRTALPVDRQGGAIPWYTYPAIEFLAARVNRTLAVFEYGSGNSTLWWRQRAGRVVSCEHDRDWHARMKSQLPNNAEYLYVALEPSGEYARVIHGYSHEFDIVVIDGRDRVACARNCLTALRPGGVVVWDNSDRSEYAEGFELLMQHGFRRLDFSGLGPINAYAWCTSVFYRSDNCFGI